MKLQYDETLSNFAFNFNLRRYTKGLFKRAADFSSTSLKQLAAAERGARAHQLALCAPALRAELADLSHLWLREAHLEMAAGGGPASSAGVRRCRLNR